jgi:curved DNA-binding protein CbpA
VSMNPFRKQNHYELLEISPGASPLEIRRAYKNAFELYKDESIVSYSFFTPEERKEIISCLEDAYLTLINPESRAEYDRTLIESGAVEAEAPYYHKTKDPISIYDIRKTHADMIGPRKRPENLKYVVSHNQLIQEIMSQDTLTGADLYKIRKELGISLDKIAEETNIRISILRAIEEDDFDSFPPMVYLKGFLKSYARHLQVDEHVIIHGYIKRVGKQHS